MNWELELDTHREIDLRQTLNDQKKECNQEFCKYVEKNYANWINNKNDDSPYFSNQIAEKFVFPLLKD